MTTPAKEKTILLGVTGCIAAYKAAELVRSLQKRGYRVKVVMTDHATEFVGPTTFRALTQEEVAVGLFDDPSDPIHHISLAQEADVFVIAPCTANVMAKLANGVADDLLTTTALATRAPLIIAPAMNVGMYENALTCSNKERLEGAGVIFVDAEDGYLACGDEGKGRLADIEKISQKVAETVEHTGDLENKNILITAGPTIEPIDSVRYVGNRSSGKMGYALARAAQRRGAHVTLVSGPVSLNEPHGMKNYVSVETAEEMYDAVFRHIEDTDIVICAAAVSDMSPESPYDRKLKKSTDPEALHTIRFKENKDILKDIGNNKGRRFVVGFAAETEDVIDNAKRKLKDKKVDCIIANEVGENIGFGAEGNKVWIVDERGIDDIPYMSKDGVAERILDYLYSRIEKP